MFVAPGHPHAARPLLPYCAAVLAAMGGEVIVEDGEDNLVRARRAGDPGEAAWVVVAAGLPNLLHELVHAVQVGCLADDHGFDYDQMPLAMSRPEHRQYLWDEFAACVLSCAWGEAEEEEAWFAEQVGILGMFWGHLETPSGFFVDIDRAIVVYAADLERVMDGAYAAVEGRLRAVGAPVGLARPRARLDFDRLWARFRAGGDIQIQVASP